MLPLLPYNQRVSSIKLKLTDQPVSDRRRAFGTQMDRDSRDLAYGTTYVPFWCMDKCYRDHGLQKPLVLEDMV